MRPRVDDVTFDDAGQLAFFDHDANKDRSLRYDGRGFLSTLADASGSIDLLRPAYSSEGLLHSLLREPTSLSPHRLNVLYFAGRPIGIWKKVGTSTATLTRIVTDHLGTPVASLQQAGATFDWHGGFEPFGEDWQAGTLQDSLAKGIFLRMPGQWKDPLWSDATYPMELFYNVHRWYESGTGRYTSVDPLHFDGVRAKRRTAQSMAPDISESGDVLTLNRASYQYAAGRPLYFFDPLGLVECVYFVTDGCLYCVSDDLSESFETCDAWSGHPPCTDNPTCEATRDQGPIPQGSWRLGCEGCTPTKWATPRIPIIPMSGTTTHGRSGFQFHQGTKPEHSRGCIVMPPGRYKEFRDFYRRDKQGYLSVVH